LDGKNNTLIFLCNLICQKLGPKPTHPRLPKRQARPSPTTTTSKRTTAATWLTNHDHVRRSTDIPLFYGKKGQDTVTLQQLVERIDKAATIAGWNTPKWVCNEFYMCLREGAMSWYNTLENIPNFNMESWDDMKTEFLKAYAP